MKKSITLCLFALNVLLTNAQDTLWNGYRITYVGKTSISKRMDANQNAKLRIQNLSNAAAQPLYFDLFIEGFTAPNAQRNLHGEFGWATFPNGGALRVPVGQQSFAQCWTQGAYENRMGNTPPASGTTKTYTIHFLFSENQGALQGPYPKNAATVLDLPVRISFVNDDTMQLYRSGNKALRLTVNAKSGGDFNMELFTEAVGTNQANVFLPTLVQRGNGSNIPYLFDFSLAPRNDWYVKIRKPGMKSEYFRLDTTQANNTVTLSEESLGSSPYTVRLLKSIKSPTGFWRGAVSEQTRSFVCIPGQENWAVSSSPKTASRMYKIDFDGNIQWTKDIGWEAWGGDMTADGKYVAVASNGATIPTPLNGNRGGDFIALFNGADGSLYDTIVSGIQSRNIKFSSDGKFLAIGDQSGVFHIYDVAQKKLALTGVGLTSFGQNRELEWLDNDNAVVISTGDGSLRKYTLASDKKSATLAWTAYTGGWGFINGLTISKDGQFIGTGTKSKDQTIINAATGEVVWTKFTGNFDVAFTPDRNRFATFGGYIFQTSNSNFLGHTGRAGVAWFSPDGKYLMQADRVQVNNGRFGDNAVTIMNDIGDRLIDAEGKNNYYDSLDLTTTGGEQAQWAYWSEDGKRIIVLSRDMDLTEEVGISIFSLDRCSIAPPTVSNITVCQGVTTTALTATAASGNTLRWYGTNASGGTASATAPIPVTTTAGQTMYYVSQYNATQQCESERASITVTVNAKPAAPTVNNVSVCVGATTSALTATAASGHTLRWYGTNATGGTASSTAPTPSAASAGVTNYYVSQVNSNSCESDRANLVFTVYALPAKPSISWNGTQLSTATGLAAYQWLLNNTAVSGATSNTHQPQSAGSYRVRVANTAGCADTSTAYDLVVTALVTPMFEGKSVSVYPNPVVQTTTIDLGQTPQQPVSLQLLHINGAAAGNWTTRQRRQVLQLGHLSAGMYLLQIQNGRNKTVIPVLKQHR
jgi:WD40 repeat protein